MFKQDLNQLKLMNIRLNDFKWFEFELVRLKTTRADQTCVKFELGSYAKTKTTNTIQMATYNHMECNNPVFCT